jgi:hypothetical protein
MSKLRLLRPICLFTLICIIPLPAHAQAFRAGTLTCISRPFAFQPAIKMMTLRENAGWIALDDYEPMIFGRVVIRGTAFAMLPITPV